MNPDAPNDTTAQAREIYRTVRMLKDRVCQKFQARTRESTLGHPCGELTFVQSNVLMAIDEHGELSLKELADALHVSRPSASAMVDRLVEMGMVQREQSQLDRRVVRIRLSPGGHVVFQALEQQILEYITALLVQLGPSFAGQWCDVYARIREIIDAEKAMESLSGDTKEGVE